MPLAGNKTPPHRFGTPFSTGFLFRTREFRRRPAYTHRQQKRGPGIQNPHPSSVCSNHRARESTPTEPSKARQRPARWPLDHQRYCRWLGWCNSAIGGKPLRDRPASPASNPCTRRRRRSANGRRSCVAVSRRSQAFDGQRCNWLNKKSRAHNSAVECHLHTVEVVGSNPAVPTKASASPKKVLRLLRRLPGTPSAPKGSAPSGALKVEHPRTVRYTMGASETRMEKL